MITLHGHVPASDVTIFGLLFQDEVNGTISRFRASDTNLIPTGLQSNHYYTVTLTTVNTAGESPSSLPVNLRTDVCGK